MKKEHYENVSEHFNLKLYRGWNQPACWNYKFLDFPTDALYIRYGIDDYVIEYNPTRRMFTHIPSRELAEEVLQFIKDTEILFI